MNDESQLTDGSASVFYVAELDNTGSARATVGLVLNFGTLNLTDSGEKLDQVLVAGRPGQLQLVSHPFSGYLVG
jgi:hypothetical protein